MSRRHHQSRPSEPSQRQRKVAEMLKQALSDIFLQETFYGTPLEGVSVTISHVTVSPDLRNATVFATPLGGEAPNYFEETLNEFASHFRHLVTKRVNLKFSPRFHFSRDDTFEEACRVNALMASLQQRETRSYAEATQEDHSPV